VDKLPALPTLAAEKRKLVTSTRVTVMVEGIEQQTPWRADAVASVTYGATVDLLFDINRRSMHGSLEDIACVVIVEHRVIDAPHRSAFHHAPAALTPAEARRRAAASRPSRRARTTHRVRRWRWTGVLRTLLGAGNGRIACVSLVPFADSARPDGLPSVAAQQRVLKFGSSWRVHEFLWWSQPDAAQMQIRGMGGKMDAADREEEQLQLDAAEAAYVTAKMAQHSVEQRINSIPFRSYTDYVAAKVKVGYEQNLALL
jgi:hypothetical protein|tara:strand:- start:874 stop:1644 length:771 start_codon:yes stop_codon:yes gene_type:complete